MLDVDATYDVVHCDWCDELTLSRRMYDRDVWILSICKRCDD